MTTLNGLAVQRALPSAAPALETETEVLESAVDQLVTGPARASVAHGRA